MQHMTIKCTKWEKHLLLEQLGNQDCQDMAYLVLHIHQTGAENDISSTCTYQLDNDS